MKIIDNLQITIKDIHIRYEDDLAKSEKSYPLQNLDIPLESPWKSSNSTPLMPKEKQSTSIAVSPNILASLCEKDWNCITSESIGMRRRRYTLRQIMRLEWEAR